MRTFWLVVATLLLYTGAQLQVLLPTIPTPLAWGLTVALFWLMLAWQFLYRSHASAIESRWFAWLAWSGAGAFGVWATFVLLSLPVNLVLLIMRLSRGDWPAASREALLAVLAAATLITLIGFWQTVRGPAVRVVPVPVDDLDDDLVGLKIVQISDIHIGPTIGRRYVERVVREVLALEPDLIAITGDLADGHPDRLDEQIAPLRRLRAPLGTYYVTGNHEYYWGAQGWINKMAEFGCTPLVDRNELVMRGGSRILVAGVADSSAHHFIASHSGDPRQVAAGAAAADFRLLLAHRPDACYAAEPAGFDLQLSGHTHGGQFFPFNLVVRLAHRYHRGLIRHGRMWLYVNPGTGYWGPPHRFWIPAEITLLRLAGGLSVKLQG